MGFLTKEDATLYRGWFKEMARLRGLPIKYRYVKEFNETIHAEIYPEDLSDPIDIDVIYEENPRVNTLKRIGWVSEDPNDKPYIMMFPFDTPHLTVEARIEIPPYKEIDNRSNIFKVTAIHTLLEYPDCWICTIVPVISTDKPKVDYRDSNYNYIKDVPPPKW